MQEKDFVKAEYSKGEMSFSRLLTIIKSKLLIIISITLIISVLAGFFAFTRDASYTASSSAIVKVKLSETNDSQYNDTILTEKYIATVVEFVKQEIVVERANEIYLDMQIDESTIDKSSIVVNFAENMFILNIKYVENFKKDEETTKLIVRGKLKAVIQALSEKVQEKDDYNPFEQKYFSVSISVHALQENPSVSVQDKKIIIVLVFVIIGFMLAVIVALLIDYFDETIKSTDELRELTGINTVIELDDFSKGKK